ncbi:hypothetical protein FQA47_000768 [Oryzias melastigma]|uniref:Uncharacterized protein n=1 Tax=Oryzias melastigma TaxID=30732 RepID=A0A834CPP1_ORYME|nr:hypothetical protein FQA47_000768 [Oryzias melastigma]
MHSGTLKTERCLQATVLPPSPPSLFVRWLALSLQSCLGRSSPHLAYPTLCFSVPVQEVKRGSREQDAECELSDIMHHSALLEFAFKDTDGPGAVRLAGCCRLCVLLRGPTSHREWTVIAACAFTDT